MQSALSNTSPSPAAALLATGLGRSHVRNLLLAGLFCTLTVVGAYIRIPLVYVPLTLQTFFVMLSGMMLGPFYGPLSQVGYVLLGLAGLPVFSHGGGLAYIFRPTFGYLLGYPLASGIIGKLLRNGEPSLRRLVTAGAGGMLAIFIPGVVILYLNLHFLADSSISWLTAVWSGFVIFLPGDALKLAGAIAAYRLLRRHVMPSRIVSQAQLMTQG